MYDNETIWKKKIFEPKRRHQSHQNGRQATIMNLIMAVCEHVQRLVLINQYAKYEVDS